MLQVHAVTTPAQLRTALKYHFGLRKSDRTPTAKLLARLVVEQTPPRPAVVEAPSPAVAPPTAVPASVVLVVLLTALLVAWEVVVKPITAWVVVTTIRVVMRWAYRQGLAHRWHLEALGVPVPSIPTVRYADAWYL